MAKKKKRLRLKGQVRRTIAALLMITAVIVAAVPAPTIKAADPSETYTYAVESEGVQFTFATYNGNEAHITAYDAWNENGEGKSSKDEIETLIIPVTVYDNNENPYTVTAVDRIDATDVAGSSMALKNIKFENGSQVNAIGDGCFAGNRGLKSVSLPKTVTVIGKEAFMDCTGLSTFTIPSSVKEIGTSCFENSGVTSVHIDNSDDLKVLSAYAFKNSDLMSITFNPNSQIEEIGDQAFFGCSNLSSVALPESISKIDLEAFLGCSSLTSLTIPKGVVTIGQGAFSGCSKLSKLSGFSDCKITQLEDSVFFECEKLKTVKLPETCTSITGNMSFYNCAALSEVYIPRNISSIPNELFSYSPGITKLTIINNDGRSSDYGTSENGDCSIDLDSEFINPSTDLTIYAFKYFDGSSESMIYQYANKNGINFVDLGNNGAAETSGVSVDENGTVISVDKRMQSETTLKIPETATVNGKEIAVTGISSKAFSEISSWNFVQIELPETCVTLGNNAFSNCGKLKRLIAPGMFESVGLGALGGTDDDLTVTGVIDANNALFIYCMDYDTKYDGNKNISTPKTFIPFSNSNQSDVGYRLTVENKSGKAHSKGGATTLTEYTPISVDHEIKIPSGVNELGVSFQNNQRLEEFIAEEDSNGKDSLTVIPDFEFMGAVNLTSVQLPATLTTFGYSDGNTPFYGCKKLETIEFAKNSDRVTMLFVLFLDRLIDLSMPDQAQPRLLSISSSFFKKDTSISACSFSARRILFSARSLSSSDISSIGFVRPRLSLRASTPPASYFRV